MQRSSSSEPSFLPSTSHQQTQPETPQTPPSYLSALREIESPPLGGLNLAATLSTHISDEHEADLIEEANISFLRTPLDPQGEWQAQNAAAAQGEMQGDGLDNNGGVDNGSSGISNNNNNNNNINISSSSSSSRLRLQERLRESGAEDRLRRERLQRVLQRLNRVHDSAYGDRTPSQNNLHDWAPGTHTNDDSFDEQLEEILHELRQRQPTTEPEALHTLHRSQLDTDREYRSRTHSSRYLGDGSTSLRSAAVLQSVRRHPRFSARSRDYMQRYILERDRIGHEGEETRARFNPTTSSDAGRFEYTRSTWQSSARASEAPVMTQRETRSSYRRNYLENPSSRRGSVSAQTWVEGAIRYLARIRSSDSAQESLAEASEAGFVTKEFLQEGHEDFVVDVGLIPKPAKTSWLAPGMVFSGSQHATPPSPSTSTPARTTTTRYLIGNNDSITSTTYSSGLPRPTSFDASRPWLSHTYQNPSNTSTLAATALPDRWPVKVMIHAVDYDTMTLSATMEAYNVPSHPPVVNNIISAANGTSSTTPRTSSITTYLEGEILDFQNFTLLTESFHSSLTTDATYWSKLEPFALTPDADLVHNLVSCAYHERLNQEYVLMRWKERCFVSTSSERARHTARAGDEVMEVAEDGCGLTISGFYYVCLRRSDGGIEGLYYDPQSSPYQHLKLTPAAGRGGGGGTWSFR